MISQAIGRHGYDQIKSRVHGLLDQPQRDDPVALLVQGIIASAILINTLAIILFTVQSISERYDSLLSPVIVGCLTIFTVEYILRIWSCTSARDPKGMIMDRVRYALHLYQIIDLLSIIPALFPFIFPKHLSLLRTLRIVSIFKLGRYSRYMKSLDQLKRVLFRKREIFGIMIFFLVFVILFSSSIMYLVENPVQPDKFSSIPAAMWWAVMTVTTVGYGDIIPVTPLGKSIAAVMTITGVLVLALPSAILATGFIEERERAKGEVQDPEMEEIHLDLIDHFRILHSQGRISDQEYGDLTGKIIRLKEKNR